MSTEQQRISVENKPEAPKVLVRQGATVNMESMVIPTVFCTSNPISQTDIEVQGNFLREYEEKFADNFDQEELTKRCPNAGFSKNIEKGQFFITFDDEALDEMTGSCREYTLPRSEESSHVRGRIRRNTKIGPILDVKVYFHQGRYGVEIMIESFFRDRTVSWVRIGNGINIYVTQTSEEILVASVENGGAGKLVAKAKPRLKATLTLSLVCIPCRERKWIDVDPGKFSHGCFEVSKFMNRLFRHDDTVREDDGAVRFD